jgi:hypothetical protein
LTATCLSFALGTATVEASKHLVRHQLGPAAGIPSAVAVGAVQFTNRTERPPP